MRDTSAARWKKSSRSMNQGACVEVAFVGEVQVMMRDSKAPDAGVLVVDRRRWAEFVAKLSK
ncbi:protein of unknown function [Actinopolyspora lacussalsi subsp. righensis]|uniref:DUF397 domain-containing protein n=1 Tax=Actinopolyspora righensis TaxID=995060 RepID=A0A1I6XJV4_9ACTN|nr:DUF397 domain-containing protein [Actinopolyspora righensis]SFT38635.1 protein of unknown function [Actinopolyspora righensis]